MSLPGFLYTLASVPMFASRPFLAAFVTAALAKWGVDIPWLKDHQVVIALSHVPAWFTSWPVILALAALATAEVLAVKHSEVRDFLHEVDGYLKTAVAILVSLAILDKDSVQTIHSIQRAGFGFHSFFAIVVGGLTYLTAALRRGVIGVLAEIDDHDDIGLQSLLNWVENSWTVLGLLFLVIFPLVALVLSALTALGLWLFQKRAERRELASKLPCAQCATPIFPHAMRCHACGTAVAEPRGVGVFGTPKDGPTRDLARHRFDLIARKRCPVCATRLTERAVRQACPTCATVTFANQGELQDYLDALQRRLPKTLLICLGFSAIPVIGVIPGVVYYRLTLVTGLRGYVPPLRGCLARVMIRVINWGIIALQPIPILGALIVPLMCLSTYSIYRQSLKGRASKDLAPAVAVLPA
ncbi:MAG TPA: hypothetical protein VGR31_07460 [Planctomycetota bacterium]|jgi:hypothetical protein|nr:hypothetical protein [Planctomycetota bacterium]